MVKALVQPLSLPRGLQGPPGLGVDVHKLDDLSLSEGAFFLKVSEI